MFFRKNASSEIETAYQEELIKNAVEKQTAGLIKVAEAIDLVANAAEIFDSVGMYKEAEYMTLVLESLAAKKKKKAPKAKKKDEEKEKSSTKTKKKSGKEEELTSEKMEENLKNKGWMFNADDNAADDDNYVSFLNRRKEKMEAAKQTPGYWRAKAKEWYKQSLEAEKKGHRSQAAECFKNADHCEAKAEELESQMHADDNWSNDNNKDDEFYAKDEREADLASIMHQIEETSGEDSFEDEWDFPLHNTRSPRRF